MSKLRFLLIGCLLGVSLALVAQSRPRLVVTIVIDGLQPDHLATLTNNFEKGGLRLLQDGVCAPMANCNYNNGGAVTDFVSLMTGSVPFYHGVVGEQRYNLVEDDLVPIFYDGRYHGINSEFTYSPKQLATTTLADMVKLTNENSKSYVIALDAATAIAFGGHTANGAIWLDDKSARLATTDFYEQGIPSWADKVNQSYTITNYLTYEWRPLYALGSYKFSPQSFTDESTESFYKLDKDADLNEQMYRFKHSPFVNTLMKDLAIRALRDEKMGVDAALDFLMVEFSARLPHEQGNAFNSAEKEDMYLRLDKDIRLLFDAIDLSVGLTNTLVLVLGNSQEPNSLKQLSKSQIANGQFNAKRAMALLNSYLMAIYGQGRYINGYASRNIYLNKSFIDKQKIDRAELENHVAQFMTEFQGVQNAYTTAEIRASSVCGNDELAKIHNSYFKNTSGDVVFTLLPGWVEVDEHNEVVGVSGQQNVTLPVYIFGANLPHKILPNVSVIDIIPTICQWLQLPQPNGSMGKVIE